MATHLLSIIIFLPLVFALIILVLPATLGKAYKYLNISSAILQTLFSILVYYTFQATPFAISSTWGDKHFVFLEKIPWIEINLGSFGGISIDYFVGVDGISLPLILLSSIVMLVGSVASWKVEKMSKGYHTLYLLLSCTIPGCFAALDFFLFYLFFELMLLPMYFLIGLWGGPRREYASIKFFLYTLFGSLFILIAIIALYISVIDPEKTGINAGIIQDITNFGEQEIVNVQKKLKEGTIASEHLVHSFNLLYMTDSGNYIPGSLLEPLAHRSIFGWEARYLIFLALFIGFAIKLPVVPLHTWLPDAHVEAPTPISVVLAGILLKVGAYGIIRCSYGVLPDAAIHFSWYVGLLGVISILYASFNALAMADIKKMIAYSSIAHMGFVLLGISSATSEGLNGSIFQMFSHGILSSLLFVIAGVLYDRSHDRTIDYYRGLAIKMPAFATAVTVAFFASLGLPGFSGFIGELFILLGAFNSYSTNGLLPRWMPLISCLGILIGAAYYLWTLQKMFFGKFSISQNLPSDISFYDLTLREKIILCPLIILAVLLGLFPGLIFDKNALSVAEFVSYLLKSGNAHL